MNRWFSDQRAVHCPACRGTSFDSEETRIAPFVAHRMLDGRDATFVHECHWCGLLWVEVFPSPGQLAAHYNGYMGEEYLRQRERYEPDFHARHPYINRPRGLRLDNEEYITKYAGVPSLVLDLGGGSGIETPFRGRVPVDIFDVNPVPPMEGCNRIDLITRKYDLVVLAHVLEHVPDPIELLENAMKAANSYIYVEVPAEAVGYGDRPRLRRVSQMRRAWHEHIQYFDENSTRALLETSGLTCLDVSTVENSVGGPVIRSLAHSRNSSG